MTAVCKRLLSLEIICNQMFSDILLRFLFPLLLPAQFPDQFHKFLSMRLQENPSIALPATGECRTNIRFPIRISEVVKFGNNG